MYILLYTQKFFFTWKTFKWNRNKIFFNISFKSFVFLKVKKYKMYVYSKNNYSFSTKILISITFNNVKLN